MIRNKLFSSVSFVPVIVINTFLDGLTFQLMLVAFSPQFVDWYFTNTKYLNSLESGVLLSEPIGLHSGTMRKSLPYIPRYTDLFVFQHLDFAYTTQTCQPFQALL